MSLDIYTRGQRQLRKKRTTVGSYRFASKIRIQMARLIWRMYSFLFISGRKKKKKAGPGLGHQQAHPVVLVWTRNGQALKGVRQRPGSLTGGNCSDVRP